MCMKATGLNALLPEELHVTEMVDGRQYDKNGLRVSFAKNYCTAYYNVAFVSSHSPAQKPKYRANTRVYGGGDKNGFLAHLGLFETIEMAAWVANTFDRNREANLLAWKNTNGMKSNAFPIELFDEKPDFQFTLIDPASCQANRAAILKNHEEIRRTRLTARDDAKKAEKAEKVARATVNNTYNISGAGHTFNINQ